MTSLITIDQSDYRVWVEDHAYDSPLDPLETIGFDRRLIGEIGSLPTASRLRGYCLTWWGLHHAFELVPEDEAAAYCQAMGVHIDAVVKQFTDMEHVFEFYESERETIEREQSKGDELIRQEYYGELMR